ncbi:MAG: hypothetical protein JRM80_05375 [Nitrososphaerota archaeon]|nr:hypothetical protein [Nitrososphaerota archaeon]
MPLKNRRGEYRWGTTRLASPKLMTDKKSYSIDDTIIANLGFRIVGGLRESFHPDVWTVAWEDYDKILNLTFRTSLLVKRGPISRKLGRQSKLVRKASFYWSRDPDLPYRIWAMIMPEDGGPPRIPLNVEDAKAKMLNFTQTFEVPASQLGTGKHTLSARAEAKWPRRSFIEKGAASGKAAQVVQVG